MPLPRPLLLLTAVAALATGVALAAGSLSPSPADAAPAPDGGTVTVTGSGSASAVPDVVRTTIGAQASGATVDEALAASNAATRQVQAALGDAGVAEGDVRTAGVQLYPQLDDQGRSVTGYSASQDLEVTLRDLEAAGATIAAAVRAGGDAARLSGFSFGLADEGPLRTRARRAAFADAREAAQEQAALAGGRLGSVVGVSEGSGGPSVARAQAASAAGAGSAVPLSPGTTDVTVTTTVRWSLEG